MTDAPRTQRPQPRAKRAPGLDHRLFASIGLSLILVGCSREPEAAPAPVTIAPRSFKKPRADHPVYSLADNRLYAHLERGGGLVVQPGSPGFGKYLHFGRPKIDWSARERVDDRWAARADTYASLSVPVTIEQAAARRIWLQLKVPSPRRLTVMINGKNGATLQLAEGWQTVAANLPPGLLGPGEVDLLLAFEAGAEGKAQVSVVQIGGTKPDDEDETTWNPARRALLLAANTALVYHVAIPPGVRLVGEVQGDGCQVDVDARAEGGLNVTGTLTGADAAVDLAPLAGRIARLRLAASGTGCTELRLVEAALARPGPEPAPAPHRRRPSHVVLWIMDSLRADRLAPFTPEARPEAPTFAALAEQGVCFTAAWAQGNESRASHASIWTALYPAVHRMITPGASLDSKWMTLGAALKTAGLTTIGVTANGFVTARWGFQTGWDQFKNHIHEQGSTRGDEILRTGLEAIAEPKSPFFLYLGTVDTHVSWRGKEPWLMRYDPRPYQGAWKTVALGRDVERMASGKITPSERDKEHLIALYDSNVSYQDNLLGKLEAKLQSWGVAEDTMLIVTADHGEELWEDGRVGHGGSLRNTLLHVPLLIVYPPLFPPGVRVTEEVELIDVLPTILDALGLAAPDEAQGTSLMPLAEGRGGGYPRGAVASQFETAHALRLFGWKLRVGASGIPSLVQLDTDPYEKRDVAATRPIERRYLTDVLSMFLLHQTQWRKSRWGAIANVSMQMADDLEQSAEDTP